MKVLFLTSSGDDYLASVLWDGFQELCGPENVHEYGSTESFRWTKFPSPCSRISGFRPSTPMRDDDRDFDLLVICSPFLKQYDWHTAKMLRECHTKPDAKVVFVETTDSATDINVPMMHVDAVFRREVDPSVDYGREVIPLLFAAPSRWFYTEDTPRLYDVFCAGNHESSPVRWEACGEVFRTQRKHRSLVSSCGGFGLDEYFGLLCNSKLCVCPPGAGSDCMRQWEAVANGCIPVFVQHPQRKRGPGFILDYYYASESRFLPKLLEDALSHNLSEYRKKMQERALDNCTTLARAKQIISQIYH